MNVMNDECCETNDEWMNEWTFFVLISLNEWMRWRMVWIPPFIKSWEISRDFGGFHWFFSWVWRTKDKRTDAQTEPLMLAQLKR